MIDDLELERIAAQGWRARHERWLGGWLLRADDGFTGRANSVLPLGDPGRDLDDALAEVAAFYGAHGLPPRLTVPTPARNDLQQALVVRGWSSGVAVDVMVGPLARLPGPVPDIQVEVLPRPSPAWRERFHLRDTEDPRVAWALLERADVVGFAQARDGDDVVAVGRGTVVEGWLGVTAVATDATHRRRGFATAVLGALTAWARSHGAAHAYLQVARSNEVAHTAYVRQGFTVHHAYRYLEATTA